MDFGAMNGRDEIWEAYRVQLSNRPRHIHGIAEEDLVLSEEETEETTESTITGGIVPHPAQNAFENMDQARIQLGYAVDLEYRKSKQTADLLSNALQTTVVFVPIAKAEVATHCCFNTEELRKDAGLRTPEELEGLLRFTEAGMFTIEIYSDKVSAPVTINCLVVNSALGGGQLYGHMVGLPYGKKYGWFDKQGLLTKSGSPPSYHKAKVTVHVPESGIKRQLNILQALHEKTDGLVPLFQEKLLNHDATLGRAVDALADVDIPEEKKLQYITIVKRATTPKG